MVVKIASKVDKNGNSYGLVFDTEKKTFNFGYSVVAWGIDFYATKTEIKQFIDYTLKPNGYTPVIKL